MNDTMNKRVVLGSVTICLLLRDRLLKGESVMDTSEAE